jgi:hypothetical protein
MSDMKCQRKHLFVDLKVQGALVARVVSYWLFCLLGIILMLLCWQIITGPARMFYTQFDSMWFHYGPAMIASFILLPLVVVDVIRFSNRFVGPMLRLRRSLRQLVQGEDVEPIIFRDNDFWHDLAVDFNTLRARVQASANTTDTEQKESELEEPVAVI